MRRFIYAVCLFSAIIPLETQAQLSESDALRYSTNILGGTARFAAMGGAFCAVGADLSTLAYNPAGIAVYNKNQLEITPGLTLQNTGANYNGTASSNEASVVNLQSIGLVATRKVGKEDAGGWRSYNFGFAYNRMNNFNDNVTVSGNNFKNTFLDNLAAAGQGTYYSNLDPFFIGPAFQVGVLDTAAGTNASQYFNIIHPFLNNGRYIQQTENIGTTGSMGEYDFSFGGNYNDKLFIGGTFGIVDVNYNLNDTYTETAGYTDTTFGFNNYTLTENLSTTGVGYNFKIGFIYRIMDWLRLGGAVHSPTFFTMSDNFSTSWTANYYPSSYSGPGGPTNPAGASTTYNYSLTTPLKAIGGAAVIINNQGILSADYEYVDYSSIRVNSTDPHLQTGYTNQINTAISQEFIQANNLKFGFEWVLYPVSFRAGYAIYGNPYSAAVGFTSPRTAYSAGIGLKVNNVFLDFTYTLTQYSEQYAPYQGASEATLNTKLTNIIFTLGYTFGERKNKIPRKQRFQQAYPPPPPPPPPGAY